MLSVLLAGLLVLLLWHSLFTSSSPTSSWTSSVSQNPSFKPQSSTQEHDAGPEVKAEDGPLHDASIYEQQQQPDSQPKPPDVFEDWRAHLEAAHAPPGALQQHTSTLGFSHIYAIQSHSPAVKQRMDLLAKSLDMSIDWTSPVQPDHPSIAWIAQQVKAVRLAKRRSVVKATRQPPNLLGGLNVGSPWLQPSVELKEVEFPMFARSHAWYRAHRISPALGSVALPSEVGNEVEGMDWVQHLLQHPARQAQGEVDVQELLRDPRETWSELQLSRESIAEWATHTRLWKKMLERGDEVALVLSDSVDLESGFERLWSQVHRHLPVSSEGRPEWHMLMLGHNSQDEQASALNPSICPSLMLTRAIDPAYLHPLLHHAADPQGLHAYAISSTGAQELLRLAEDPWTAHQTHLDIFLSTFSRAGAVNIFSIDPPIAVDLPAHQAVVKPERVTQRVLLADSATELIWKAQGVELPERKMEPPQRQTSGYRFSSPKPPPHQPQLE